MIYQEMSGKAMSHNLVQFKCNFTALVCLISVQILVLDSTKCPFYDRFESFVFPRFCVFAFFHALVHCA